MVKQVAGLPFAVELAIAKALHVLGSPASSTESSPSRRRGGTEAKFASSLLDGLMLLGRWWNRGSAANVTQSGCGCLQEILDDPLADRI